MMPDREKVIKALESCTAKPLRRKSDKYVVSLDIRFVNTIIALLKELEGVSQGVVDQIRWERNTAISQLAEIGKGLGEKMDDIVALLKELKAVEPRVSTAEQRCGNCNKVIEMDGWVACPWCGKRIDWEGWWKKNGTRNQDT